MTLPTQKQTGQTIPKFEKGSEQTTRLKTNHVCTFWISSLFYFTIFICLDKYKIFLFLWYSICSGKLHKAYPFLPLVLLFLYLFISYLSRQIAKSFFLSFICPGKNQAVFLFFFLHFFDCLGKKQPVFLLLCSFICPGK